MIGGRPRGIHSRFSSNFSPIVELLICLNLDLECAIYPVSGVNDRKGSGTSKNVPARQKMQKINFPDPQNLSVDGTGATNKPRKSKVEAHVIWMMYLPTLVRKLLALPSDTGHDHRRFHPFCGSSLQKQVAEVLGSIPTPALLTPHSLCPGCDDHKGTSGVLNLKLVAPIWNFFYPA